jgi:YD repeat-containing protein
MGGRVRAACILTVLLAVGVARVGAQGAIQYVYDAVGRLIAVIDTSGDTATYTYDAVGNILSIGRHASSQVTVISFAPPKGPVGATVTIFGTGFSATANQNTVTFNGTAASVTSASATQLVVAVPSGATNGAIGVTAPAGSASSAASFVVTAGSTTPTITSFSPTIGVAGTSVTVNGTNFEATAGNDRTQFNTTLASVTSATTTALTAAVSPFTGSGHISVSTPNGTAVSTADFIVPPTPYTATDVESAGRIAFNTSTTVSVSTSGKIALKLFDGTAGHRISLVGTNGMSGQIFGCDVTVTILNPNGTLLSTPTCMESEGYIDTLTLRTSGTYTIEVDPAGSATGSVTLKLYDFTADVTGTITPSGSSVTFTTAIPGQNGIYTFSETAGHRISLLGTNGMLGQLFLACDVNVTIRQPDGSPLGSTCMEGGGYIDTMTVPTTGTYTIQVDPQGWSVGNLTLNLYDVPAEVSGSITPGGSAVTVTMSTPGQNGALTFTGTVGHRISLLGTNGMFGQIFGCDVNVTILKPDSSVLVPATCTESSGYVDVTALASSGTYTIQIDPVSQATGSVTLTLYDVPSDVTGTIVPNGSSVTVTISAPGQNAALTFSGTSGHRVSLRGVNGMSGQVFGCDVTATILKPDTSVLAGPTCMEGSGFMDVTALPTTGTYTIAIDPAGSATGSLTLTLYDVPADASATITPGGSAVPITMATPGQNGSLTFSGISGHRVSLAGSGWTSGQVFGCDVNVAIINPDTSVLAGSTCMEAGGFIDVRTLPATGTYTITVDPVDIATSSLTLTLYDVPADASGSVSIGGSAATVTTSTPGQNGAVTFTGTASQQVTVHVTNNPWTSLFSGPTLKLLDTNGSTVLTSTTSSNSSFNLSTVTLPSSGTYTIVIDPADVLTGSINVSVTSP